MFLGDLRADVNKIRDKFFAAGSKHANFLNSYVQGLQQLPVTTTGVRGLPKVLRHSVVESQDSKPNLLFLDLPDPPPSVGVPVPERFRSNVLLGVLEKMQAQDLPVFSVRLVFCCNDLLDVKILDQGAEACIFPCRSPVCSWIHTGHLGCHPHPPSPTSLPFGRRYHSVHAEPHRYDMFSAITLLVQALLSTFISSANSIKCYLNSLERYNRYMSLLTSPVWPVRVAESCQEDQAMMFHQRWGLKTKLRK